MQGTITTDRDDCCKGAEIGLGVFCYELGGMSGTLSVKQNRVQASISEDLSDVRQGGA